MNCKTWRERLKHLDCTFVSIICPRRQPYFAEYIAEHPGIVRFSEEAYPDIPGYAVLYQLVDPLPEGWWLGIQARIEAERGSGPCDCWATATDAS